MPNYGKQIDFLLVGFGADLAGGHVHFYEAGTTTDKNAYSDKEVTTPITNPSTLDANGRIISPIYGNGWYKIAVHKADGTVFATLDDLYYQVVEPDEDIAGTAKTDNYQAVEGDDLITANATAGNIIITLPDVTALTNRVRIVVKKIDGTTNTVTVKGSGTQNIDGVNTKVLDSEDESITVVASPDKTEWIIEDRGNVHKLDGYHASTTPAAYVVPVTNQYGKLDFETFAIPAGLIAAYGGAVAPSGWLLCNGEAFSRTTYADLFAAIGTSFGGGDGVTTFNVPNILGRSIVGAGSGSGLTPRALGAAGGEENHLLTITEMPSHSHGLYQWVDGYGGYSGTSVQTLYDSLTEGVVFQTLSQGGGAAHNNMHPFTVATYIIKY